MFSGELEGTIIHLVVAQRWFEAKSEGGVWHAFSTLLPLLHEDGHVADPLEFPANGDVWWLLRQDTRDLAQPGRVLTGELEVSNEADSPGKAWYQVRPDNVQSAHSKDLIEVLEVPADWIAEPREFISRHKQLAVDHPPMDTVYVQWSGNLYGPFQVSRESDDEGGTWMVRLKTVNQDHSVRRAPEAALKRLPTGREHRLRQEVSLGNLPPYRSPKVHACHYRLVAAEAFQTAIGSEASRLVLESDEAILTRAARKLFTRSKRQDLQRLLGELQGTAEGAAPESGPDVASVVRVLRDRLDKEDHEGETLATALLTSGVMDEDIARAKARVEQEHVSGHAARLKAEIDARVADLRRDLADAGKKKQALEEEIAAMRRNRLAAIEREVEEKRQEQDRQWREREEQFEQQRRELDRQRELLRDNLARVSKEMAENRDGLVNQFLAISPLLQQLGLVQGPHTGNGAVAAVPASAEAPGRNFTLPAFVHGGSSPPPVSEVEFFERFARHVEASGFRHERLDLASFHLSVKTNDLTILGGPPGTGKSSLPRLYTEALAGDEYAEGMQRYLHVGVSPSWLDMRDLLGHANALDHCFQPAESGLYQQMIWAQEEAARRGPDSRLYLVCLDEMNLAQVEHYFSAFIQALERPADQREVRCFAPEVVSATDAFAAWATLRLPQTVRFVGTVNFDETTRQLSQRVLDRANLVRLHPRHFLDAPEAKITRSAGPPVTLRHYRDWTTVTQGLPTALADLLDKMKDPLARLGCPLNQRRTQAIHRFVASALRQLCTPEQAFDLQVAQRLLPHVRSLFRPGANEALTALQKLLQAQPSGFPASLRVLEELRAADYPADLLGEGGEA